MNISDQPSPVKATVLIAMSEHELKYLYELVDRQYRCMISASSFDVERISAHELLVINLHATLKSIINRI